MFFDLVMATLFCSLAHDAATKLIMRYFFLYFKTLLGLVSFLSVF